MRFRWRPLARGVHSGPGSLALLYLLPLIALAQTAPRKPAASAEPSPRDLKYPPAHTVQLPKVATSTLPNGMRIYLLEQREMPVIGGVAMIRTGSAFDPPERTGLAAIAGILLRNGGTALKTGDQVDDALQNLGMTMESSIAETAGMIGFTALKDQAEPSLGLVKEVLTQPEFRLDRLEQIKTQMRSAIAHRNDDGATIAKRELLSVIFGKDSPYGKHPDYATVDRIGRAELKKFHKRYFFPANVMLGVWGDFDAAQMKATIEKLFADWTASQPPAPEFPKVTATAAAGVYLAEKKTAAQAYIAAGHLGGVASQKDFPALEVMGLIFNALQARISQRARAQLGNSPVSLVGVSVDDVDAVWGAGFERPGVFRISASTRGASTTVALRAIRDDVERMRTAEVSDEELKKAKEGAIATQAIGWDTHGKAFLRMMNQEYYGYPQDFAEQYQNGIAAVTKADVLRVAKQYLDPAKLAFVVVANPQFFTEPLEKFNPQVNKIDLTIADPKPAAAESSDATLAEGKRLLARAQAAAGGAARLEAVKDFQLVTNYLLDPTVANFGGPKVVETDRWIAPVSYRQDLQLPLGRRVAAYTDGKGGWISTQQGWGPLLGVQLKQLQGDLFRSYVPFLLSDRIEGRTVNAVDEDEIEISDATGMITRVEFDSKTGLPRRVLYDLPQSTGAPLATEDLYDDYRDIDGIKFPFKMTVNQGGKHFADVTVTDFKVNAGLKAADLARRQP